MLVALLWFLLTEALIGAGTQVGEPGSAENSVWFKAIVPVSGGMAIGTCGENFDTELNVYSVTDCSDFNTYTDLGYADWNPWGCAGSHPEGIEFNYELTDVNGKVIATELAAINGTESATVNLENLENGFYLIRVYNDNAEKTFRVVKQ